MLPKPFFLLVRNTKDGKDCKFCHLCEPGEKKRRKKVRFVNLKALFMADRVFVFSVDF